MVCSSHAFLFTSHFPLYVLSDMKEFEGVENRLDTNGSIQKAVLAMKPPRFGSKERGNPNHLPSTLLKECDGSVEVFRLIAEVCS